MNHVHTYTYICAWRIYGYTCACACIWMDAYALFAPRTRRRAYAQCVRSACALRISQGGEGCLQGAVDEEAMGGLRISQGGV